MLEGYRRDRCADRREKASILCICPLGRVDGFGEIWRGNEGYGRYDGSGWGQTGQED